MFEKIKETAAHFKGHSLLTLIWFVVSAAVSVTLLFLPYWTGELLFRITGSESLYKTMDTITLYWVLGVMAIGIVYSLVGLHMKLSLFRNMGNTVIGFSDIMRGGALGILLIIPNLFIMILKVFFASFAGFFCLIAMIAAFVMTRTVPVLKNA